MSSNAEYDIAVIGAGVIGCAVAAALSRSTCRIAVFEKEADVGFGISSANSGVVHSGIHYRPGTFRARFNVTGNRMMEQLCRELQVPFSPVGKLTVALEDSQRKSLRALLEQGEKNGVPGLRIVNQEEMEHLQPGVAGVVALYSPSTGIVSPYELTIALAERACANGAEFSFCTRVTGIERPRTPGSHFHLTARKGDWYGPGSREVRIAARVVINAAGLGSYAAARMVGVSSPPIYPCRGEYHILDKRLKGSLGTLVYPVPEAHSGGLGIHLTSTAEGVILIGPSNEYISDGEYAATTRTILQALREEGHRLLPSLDTHDFIRCFAGTRPKLAPPEEGGFRDFIIESSREVPGFINLTGIESPGLTSAPAIAEYVRNLTGELLPLHDKPEFIQERPVINGVPFSSLRFADASPEEKEEMAARNPEYGSIVCRCETVTLAEVKEAAGRIFGPVTLAGIKYRTRTMMGRCQGGFCLQRISDILHEHCSIPIERQTLKGPGSELFPGRLREEQ
jgi:glycerol-3-phosphate dehydrogenase